MKPRANAAPIVAELPVTMSGTASARATRNDCNTPAERYIPLTDLEQARDARRALVAGRTPSLPMQGDRR